MKYNHAIGKTNEMEVDRWPGNVFPSGRQLTARGQHRTLVILGRSYQEAMFAGHASVAFDNKRSSESPGKAGKLLLTAPEVYHIGDVDHALASECHDSVPAREFSEKPTRDRKVGTIRREA